MGVYDKGVSSMQLVLMSEERQWCWLTVGVQEGECVTGGNRRPQEPSGDEAFPFSLADHTDYVKLLQILIQLVLQHICKCGISVIHTVKLQVENSTKKSDETEQSVLA